MLVRTLNNTGIVAIVRDLDPADALPAGEALGKGGVNVVEVSLNEPAGAAIARALRRACAVAVGVGADLLRPEFPEEKNRADLQGPALWYTAKAGKGRCS